MGRLLKSFFLRKREPLHYPEIWKIRYAVYCFLKGRTKSSEEFSLVSKVKSVYKLLTDTTRMNIYLNITFGCIN